MNRVSRRLPTDIARDLFRSHGGVLKTSEAISLGIQPRTLYEMRDSGELDQVARGLFRVNSLSPLKTPDLFTVASKIPKSVVCLVSALTFHGLTTQVPREVSIALPKGAKKPKIDSPPIGVYWISEPAFSEGIELHQIEGISIRIYSIEKTLADCF